MTLLKHTIQFGASLLAADFNKDGYADLVVGSPGNTIGGILQTGSVDIIYGSAGGLNSQTSLASRQTWSQDSPDILDISEAYDGFGKVLAAGDFNKDGYQDLVVGTPYESIGTLVNAGGIDVLYGSAKGISAKNNQFWSQDSAGILDRAESVLVSPPWDDVSYYAGDEFGASVATGDFNKDGYADVIVGAPGESIGTLTSAGAVNVLYGSATGLTATDNQFWSQDSASILDVLEAYDRFGSSLTTGDFNKDGYMDAAIGVPNEDLGTTYDAGAVFDVNFKAQNQSIWNTGGEYIANAFGIPLPSLAGEKSLDLGIADFKLIYDLLDVDLISKLLLRQKFDLAVDKLTGQLVLENGQAIDFTAGQDITFVVPQNIGNSLDFKVSLNLGAKLTNQTAIGYDVDAELEALQATFKYDLPGYDGSKSFGPLVDEHYDILNGDISLYNKTFALGGLNTQAVSFAIAA